MPLLAAQVPNGFVDLRHGDRRARQVGRLRRDDRGGGVHHHHELLRLRRHFRGGQRIRRQREAGEDVGVVAHDQLLRQALGDLGGDAADVLADHLDLLAGDHVAVLLHIELDAVVELHAGIGELPGKRQDHADLDRLLSLRAGTTGEQRQEAKA